MSTPPAPPAMSAALSPQTSSKAGAARTYGATTRKFEPMYVETTSDESSVDHFLIPNHYKGSVSSILISHGTIMDRVEKLALDIRQAYEGETIHLLCVLKGGSAFFQDLLTALRNYHAYVPRRTSEGPAEAVGGGGVLTLNPPFDPPRAPPRPHRGGGAAGPVSPGVDVPPPSQSGSTSVRV